MKVTVDCFRFVLKSATGKIQLSVGEHVQVMVKDEKGAVINSAPYTPVASSEDGTSLDLLFKVYPGGKVSSYLGAMEEGATVALTGPHGVYKHRSNF